MLPTRHGRLRLPPLGLVEGEKDGHRKAARGGQGVLGVFRDGLLRHLAQQQNGVGAQPCRDRRQPLDLRRLGLAERNGQRLHREDRVVVLRLHEVELHAVNRDGRPAGLSRPDTERHHRGRREQCGCEHLRPSFTFPERAGRARRGTDAVRPVRRRCRPHTGSSRGPRSASARRRAPTR